MNDRRLVASGDSSHYQAGTSTNSNRLSAYEHLPRPLRARRSRTSFTANEVTGSSDVSSSLVSPTNVTHATPRPKSPREPRPLRPDYSAAKLSASTAWGERQSTAKTGNLKRSMSVPIKTRSKTPTPQPILAAQHFQSAVVKEERDFDAPPRITPPLVPPQEPNWKTTDVTISGDSTTSATTPSSISSPPRAQPRRRPRQSPSPPRTRTTKRPPSRSRGLPVRMEEPEESLLRGCIQGVSFQSLQSQQLGMLVCF